MRSLLGPGPSDFTRRLPFGRQCRANEEGCFVADLELLVQNPKLSSARNGASVAWKSFETDFECAGVVIELGPGVLAPNVEFSANRRRKRPHFS